MKKKILLVDDDCALSDSLKDILEDSDYTVYMAGTGAEAMAALDRNAIDLIILDYNLPDGKGLDWAARFNEHRYGIKIFLITGMSESDLNLRSEIKAFIQKPVAIPDLLRQIAEALN